jgi:MFS-type transporter involved in bile tolerance (Atg22 family)
MRVDPVSLLGTLTNEQWAWCIFDAGGFGFFTATYSTYAQMWFFTVAIESGYDSHQATAKWGYLVSVALTLSALLSPVVGWLADLHGCRKLTLMVLVFLACASLMLATQMNAFAFQATMLAVGYALSALTNPIYASFMPSLITNDPTGWGVGAHDLSIMSALIGNLGSAMVLGMDIAIGHGENNWGLVGNITAVVVGENTTSHTGALTSSIMSNVTLGMDHIGTTTTAAATLFSVASLWW